MDENTQKDEQGFMAIASLGAIFGIVIPLIMWVLKKDNFSEYTKNFLTDIVNFELILTIIGIVSGFIPVGFIIAPIVWIVNLVIVLRCYSASKVFQPYSFPFNVKIIG